MKRKLKKALKRKIETLPETKFLSAETLQNGHVRVTYKYKDKLNFVTMSSSPNNNDENIAAKIAHRDIRRKNKGIY